MKIFHLNNAEKEKADSFIANHSCTIEKDCFGYPKLGAIGGQFTFSFTVTSLGQISIIKCACGAEETLTDFEDW